MIKIGPKVEDRAKTNSRILRDWERFLANGCKKEKFTKALYGHLYQNFGFIAHYNQHGFHGARFCSLPDLRHTFRDILEPESYYMDRGSSIELNKEIQRVLRKYEIVLLKEAEDRELANMKIQHAALGQEIDRREGHPNKGGSREGA